MLVYQTPEYFNEDPSAPAYALLRAPQESELAALKAMAAFQELTLRGLIQVTATGHVEPLDIANFALELDEGAVSATRKHLFEQAVLASASEPDPTPLEFDSGHNPQPEDEPAYYETWLNSAGLECSPPMCRPHDEPFCASPYCHPQYDNNIRKALIKACGSEATSFVINHAYTVTKSNGFYVAKAQCVVALKRQPNGDLVEKKRFLDWRHSPDEPQIIS